MTPTFNNINYLYPFRDAIATVVNITIPNTVESSTIVHEALNAINLKKTKKKI